MVSHTRPTALAPSSPGCWVKFDTRSSHVRGPGALHPSPEVRGGLGALHPGLEVRGGLGSRLLVVNGPEREGGGGGVILGMVRRNK